MDKYTYLFNKDYNNLITNYTRALNIIEFLYDISKNLSDININIKYDKYIEYIYNNNMSIDDLYYADRPLSCLPATFSRIPITQWKHSEGKGEERGILVLFFNLYSLKILI